MCCRPMGMLGKTLPLILIPFSMLTVGPLLLLEDLRLRGAVDGRARGLPCLAAIQRLRWKLLSPEMAMCMLMVSRKRVWEPWGTPGARR